MITYKIVKQEGEDITIEKSGHAHEFTVAYFKDELAKLAKLKTGLEAQKKLEEAKISNYKEHNAFLDSLTLEQLHAAYLCYEAAETARQCEEKLKEIEAVDVEHAEAIKEIEEQTGVKI